MEYRLLGPLEVLRDGEALNLGAPKQRVVLAVLLANRGRVVSSDRLIDAVWGDTPPASPLTSLQAYISNLRRILRDVGYASPIVRQSPGYLLHSDGTPHDAEEFRRLTTVAHDLAGRGEWRACVDSARAALALWRGPVLSDVEDAEWVRQLAVELDEERYSCREVLATALSGLGEASAAVAVAQELRDEHQFRDHAAWLAMMTLYRARRAVEALEVYRGHVQTLDEELGLEPGAELRDLQVAILGQSPALDEWPTSAVAPESAAAPGTPDSARHDLTDTLVGRDLELEVIDSMLEAVSSSHARQVVLTGPAGIGKSRLALEAARRMENRGGRVIWTRCLEEEGGPAWWPLREVARSLNVDPDVVLLPPADTGADGARFVVYERFLELLTSAMQESPVMVVVDDAQWSDATSLRCLAYLAGALGGHKFGLVMTVRAGEAPSETQHLLAAVGRGHAARHLEVPPLGAAEVAELVASVCGERPADDDAIVLTHRTAGNPLYVSEYARLPADERRRGTIPVAVRSVLGRRISRLDDSVLVVLRVAAVVGESIDPHLLAAVTGRDVDAVMDALDLAADEHIIGVSPGAAGYAFAHGMLRDEILDGISALRRQRLHARIAAAIGAEATGDQLTRRAQHLMAALPLADAVEAVEACIAVARAAEVSWNSDSAAEWWEAASKALALAPPGPLAEQHDADDLLVARVDALARAGRGQTVLDTVEAGLLDAAREGRTQAIGRLAGGLLRMAGNWPWVSYGEDSGPLLMRLAEIEPIVADDASAHARVLAALAVGTYYDSDPATPRQLGRRAMEIAESVGDPDLLADALLGLILSETGIASLASETLARVDRLDALPHTQSRLDAVIAHDVRTLAMVQLGDIDGVVKHIRLGAAGADLLRLPVVRLQLRLMEAAVAQWHGAFAEAVRLRTLARLMHAETELYDGHVHESAELMMMWELGGMAAYDPELAESVEQDSSDRYPWAAAAAAARGDKERAEALVAGRLSSKAPELWPSSGTLTVTAHVVADLALVEHVETMLEKLAPYAGQIGVLGQLGTVSPVDLARARLEAVAGRRDRALELLAAATELAERTDGKPSSLRCRLLRAELDPPSAARVAVLQKIATEADTLGMKSVAASARALIA